MQKNTTKTIEVTPTAPVKLTRRQQAVQAVKFLFFSISAGVIQTLVFTLLEMFTPLGYWLCYLPALIASVVYNFTVNRAFTFKSAANVPVAMLKVFAYYCVFTPLSTWWGEALTNATFWGESLIASGWVEYIVLFFTMVVNFVTEFLFCSLFVYRNTMNTNKLGQKEQAKLEKKDNE